MGPIPGIALLALGEKAAVPVALIVCLENAAHFIVAPADIIVLLEGEEECGSPSLPEFIEAYRDELKCDVAFICDAEMWSPTQPAITTQLKGLVHEKVTISAPNPDLHSGHYGAVAANPIRILSTILAGDALAKVSSDLERLKKRGW